GDLVGPQGGNPRIYERIRGSGRRGFVEAIDQICDRALRPIAVVLDLEQADDVGIEAEHGGDDLGTLSLELLGGVGPTRRWKSTPEAVAIEEVEDIEACDPEVAGARHGSGPGRRRQVEHRWLG